MLNILYSTRFFRETSGFCTKKRSSTRYFHLLGRWPFCCWNEHFGIYQVAWNDVQQWKMSIISWGLWKGHWAHFVKFLFACKIHNFRVIFKNIKLILDSFWSYKMTGLQNFQGLRPLDPYQGPALNLLGGLQHPQTPAVSGNDRWSLHITPLTQCEYSVIIRDMDFFPSFHWRDTNFFGNFCWRDKNFFHGSFSQNTGPVLPINNEQPLTVDDSAKRGG